MSWRGATSIDGARICTILHLFFDESAECIGNEWLQIGGIAHFDDLFRQPIVHRVGRHHALLRRDDAEFKLKPLLRGCRRGGGCSWQC